MAIGLDAITAGAHSINANPIPSPQNFSFTVGNGEDRCLVVPITMRGGGSSMNISAVSYGGVAMQKVTTEPLASSIHTAMFYLANPLSGSNTVSVTLQFSLGGGTIVVSCISLVGVDQINPLNAFNKAAATNTGPMETTVNTTVEGCWVIDACSMRTGSSDTASMAARPKRSEKFNSLFAPGNSLRSLISIVEGGPAGAYDMEWTKTFNHDWAILAAAFAPSPNYKGAGNRASRYLGAQAAPSPYLGAGRLF